MTKFLDRVARRLGYEPVSTQTTEMSRGHEIDQLFHDICRQMPGARVTELFTTFQTTRYVIQNGIPGDFVECGVFEGKQIRMMALTAAALGDTSRQIYLYDTFVGMTEPTEYDVKVRKRGNLRDSADTKRMWQERQQEERNDWCYCGIDAVRENALGSGYPPDNFHFVEGDVLGSLPNECHDSIALLRCDTDWYESSYHELVHLYDLVPSGGVLVFDDYGGWEGQRKAVDQFFSEREEFPLLHRTSWRERVMVKQSVGGAPSSAR